MTNERKKVKLLGQTEDGTNQDVWIWKDDILKVAFSLLAEVAINAVMRDND